MCSVETGDKSSLSFEDWYIGIPIRVSSTVESGRFLKSTTYLKEGTTLMATYPFSWAVMDDQTLQTCRRCMGPLFPIQKECKDDSSQERDQSQRFPCKICQRVFYCCSSCRTSDQGEHFACECKILKSWQVQQFDGEIITEMKLALRTIARLTAEVAQTSLPSSPCRSDQSWDQRSCWRDYRRLISQPKDFPSVLREDFLRCRVANYLAELWYWALPPVLSSFLFTELTRPDQEEASDTLPCFSNESLKVQMREQLLHVLCRNRRNAFCYGSGHSEDPQGYGVYVPAALFNHSCQPNITLRTVGASKSLSDLFEGQKESQKDGSSHRQASLDRSNPSGPLLLFVAARDIDEAEELTISYLDNGGGQFLHQEEIDRKTDPYDERELRRSELLSSYFFSCECFRCAGDDGVSDSVNK